MANQYTDLQIIECNRLHSEEAKSGNNENFAMWQNNLQDIVHLEAGDKVSVHGAMVSERGAGQSSSIEIKGETLGFSKTFNFTTIDEKNASDFLPTKFEIIECNASSQIVEFKDDSLNFTTSYYVTMNGHNYIHIPRRWWYRHDTSASNDSKQWIEPDNLSAGLSFFNPFKDTFQFYDDYYQIVPTTADQSATPRVKNFKSKNNNDRYTILLRDRSYYSESSASGNLEDYGKRDPENAIYRTHKELKSFTIPAGFNSPEYVAEELTRQLQNITDTRTYDFRRNADIVENENVPGFPINFYKTISTETYKPFNVACYYKEDLEDFKFIESDFNFYINASGDGNNASGYQWLSQYHCIATKRPELYETGRLVNRFFTTYRGIFGSVISGTATATGSVESTRLTITQDYNETNCRRWYEFFKAQELYPEIWNTFSDERSGYSAGDTINNSRWLHMNRFENASQAYDGSVQTDNNAMLGDSGYVLHSWNSSNEYQPSSAIFPLFYNPSDRDTFYENPEPEQYSFGCMKRSIDDRIDFELTENNGWGSAFMTMMLENATVPNVLRLRKLGFDMHFSAPGMSYVLPYAGWSNIPNSYSEIAQTLAGNYILSSGAQERDEPGEFTLDSTIYKNKIYIGADSPKIKFNGTNFTLSDLHTGINAGNYNITDNPKNASLVGFGDSALNQDATDVIYVINPKEQWNDWTPARKPYIMDESQENTQILNSNLEAWTIYDSLCGIFINDLNLTETQWTGSLWDILGFSYKQFNSNNNTRITRIDNTNVNSLSVITTNAEVNQGDSKVYIQNLWKAPLYNNMIGGGGTRGGGNDVTYLPEIKQKTESIEIVADNLPIRMIRGYYTIRSNILQDSPFVGGKVNNTTMPIIGIVDKINGDGDFYFGQESSLEFTVTKPIRLASITCSIHDPDQSYARCSDQSAVLFKIQKNKIVTFNIAEQLLEEQNKK